MCNISTSISWMISSRPCLPDKLVFFSIDQNNQFRSNVYSVRWIKLQRTFQTAKSHYCSTQTNTNGEKILINMPYFIKKKPENKLTVPWLTQNMLFIWLSEIWVDRDVVLNKLYKYYSIFMSAVISIFIVQSNNLIYIYILFCDI